VTPALISLNGGCARPAQASAMARKRLAHELMLVVALKLLLLTVIYFLCFSPAHRVDPAAGIARIFSSPAQG
jgi:hypothetical protein